jgi:hypothetical protein
MRNRVIHGYDKIDDEIGWGTVIRHLPELKSEVIELLNQHVNIQIPPFCKCINEFIIPKSKSLQFINPQVIISLAFHTHTHSYIHAFTWYHLESNRPEQG